MLHKLWIKQFRNLRETTLDFSHGRPVVIWGDNNQGKTNFLESIYTLGLWASPVGALSHCVEFDTDAAYIGGDVGDLDALQRLYIKITPDGQKVCQLNQEMIRSVRRVKSLFPVGFLSSDVIRIFKESPDSRRSDLNRFCDQYIDGYGALLKQYSRVMKQKNQSLKEQADRSIIQLWNTQLLELAPQLVAHRKAALSQLDTHMSALLEAGDFPLPHTVRCEYHAFRMEAVSDHEYQSSLAELLDSNLDKECRAGYGLYGPHRDDIELFIGDRSLFYFYSRGINRLMAVIWTLAQLVSLKQHANHFPVLLLDDTFSEVDDTMKKKVMTLIQERTQVFYTSVLKDDALCFSDPEVFCMEQGVLTRA